MGLQKIDDDNTKSDSANSGSDETSESEGSDEEDELDAIRPMFKLPIQFDLDELAGAFLANNQKWVNAILDYVYFLFIMLPFC